MNEREMAEVPFAVNVHLALVEAYESSSRVDTRFFARWGLTPQQYNTMRVLYFAEVRGIRLSEIGERLLQRVPDVSRLVDRLERAGLARRSPHPDDGRAVLVELTPKGRTLVEEMDSDVMHAHEGWYSALTPSEQRRLESLLKKTSAALQASVEDP
jgi:MarR family multiple gene transcriptional regulator MgrA